MSCNCCGRTDNDGSPGLIWDTVSAIGSRYATACGTSGFLGSGLFLTKTLVINSTIRTTYTDTATPPYYGNTSTTASYTDVTAYSSTVDGCRSTYVCNGSVLATSAEDQQGPATVRTGTYATTPPSTTCVFTGDVGIPTPNLTDRNMVHTVTNIKSAYVYEVTTTTGTSSTTFNYYSTTSLADEDNAATMEARVVLPAYDGVYDATTGNSSRYLAASELSIALEQSKYKISHSTPSSCYLRVWIERVFSPESGGDDVVSDLAEYLWSGGTGCYSATAVESEATTLAIPSTNGTATARIKKYSCVAGYEPGTGQQNGFPA